MDTRRSRFHSESICFVNSDHGVGWMVLTACGRFNPKSCFHGERDVPSTSSPFLPTETTAHNPSRSCSSPTPNCTNDHAFRFGCKPSGWLPMLFPVIILENMAVQNNGTGKLGCPTTAFRLVSGDAPRCFSRTALTPHCRDTSNLPSFHSTAAGRDYVRSGRPLEWQRIPFGESFF